MGCFAMKITGGNEKMCELSMLLIPGRNYGRGNEDLLGNMGIRVDFPLCTGDEFFTDLYNFPLELS